MMAQYDKQVILDTLRELDFLWIGRPIRDGWFGSVIGWNVFASSILRKSFTLERLKEEIELNHLPLEIKDEPNVSNAFQVFIKNAA